MGVVPCRVPIRRYVYSAPAAMSGLRPTARFAIPSGAGRAARVVDLDFRRSVKVPPVAPSGSTERIRANVGVSALGTAFTSRIACTARSGSPGAPPDYGMGTRVGLRLPSVNIFVLPRVLYSIFVVENVRADCPLAWRYRGACLCTHG